MPTTVGSSLTEPYLAPGQEAEQTKAANLQGDEQPKAQTLIQQLVQHLEAGDLRSTTQIVRKLLGSGVTRRELRDQLDSPESSPIAKELATSLTPLLADAKAPTGTGLIARLVNTMTSKIPFIGDTPESKTQSVLKKINELASNKSSLLSGAIAHAAERAQAKNQQQIQAQAAAAENKKFAEEHEKFLKKIETKYPMDLGKSDAPIHHRKTTETVEEYQKRVDKEKVFGDPNKKVPI